MTESIQDRIQQRLQALGKTAGQVSREATGSPDTIRAIMRGARSPRSNTLQKLATALETTESWLINGDGTEDISLATDPARGDVKVAQVEVPLREAMPLNLPLMGTAAGSHIKGASQLLGVVDYVRRPPALWKRRNAYALTIEGNSMDPEHPHGELRFVDPEAQINLGDSVIVQTVQGAMDDVEASIGHLRARNDNYIVLGKLNPIGDLNIERRKVIAVHKVLSMRELFAV